VCNCFVGLSIDNLSIVQTTRPAGIASLCERFYWKFKTCIFLYMSAFFSVWILAHRSKIKKIGHVIIELSYLQHFLHILIKINYFINVIHGRKMTFILISSGLK